MGCELAMEERLLRLIMEEFFFCDGFAMEENKFSEHSMAYSNAHAIEEMNLLS